MTRYVMVEPGSGLDQPRLHPCHVAARNEHVIDGAGLASLMDLWAKRVAELFVLSTRFDPFHGAESEQLVYDNLPQWLKRLQDDDSAELTLPHEIARLVLYEQLYRALSIQAGMKYHREPV